MSHDHLYFRDQIQGGIHIDTLTTERYIELMCRFSPQLVYPFLKSAETYRMEQVMEVHILYKIPIMQKN